MFHWPYVLIHLLNEAAAARRDVRVRFLKAQVRILRRKLGGDRVIPSPEDRACLLAIGAELDHDIADVIGIETPKTYDRCVGSEFSSRSIDLRHLHRRRHPAFHADCPGMSVLSVLDGGSVRRCHMDAKHPGWLNWLRGMTGGMLLASLAASTAAQELSFNGARFDTGSREVLLSPGEPNCVEVAWPEDAALPGSAAVSWELTSPGGLVRSGESRISSDSRRPRFELGPLAAPPTYEYDAGEVFQKGYRLAVHVRDDNGRSIHRWIFYQEHGQTPSDVQQGMGERPPAAQRIRLVAGVKERVVYNPRFGSSGPLSLRLGECVLRDPDDLEIRARLHAGEVPERLPCLLRVAGPQGPVWQKELELIRGADWRICRADACKWPTGDYTVELLPRVGGQTWADCPRLYYRRRSVDRNELRISPVAPWSLTREAARPELRITDFREAARKAREPVAAHWRWIEHDGGVAVSSNGEFAAAPLVLRLGVQGWQAVFATFEDGGGFIQCGRAGLIRAVAAGDLAPEVFLETADLTDGQIRIYPSRDTASKLVSLRLVPVTPNSAQQLARRLAQPPLPMLSVNDWAEYFGTSWIRLLPDQFAAIVGGEAEIGFRTVGWSVGRSWVEYPSTLPHAQVFPCVPYEEAKKSPGYPNDPYDYTPRIVMMNRYDPLAGACEAGKRLDAKVWGWLAMQRHYGESMYGGIFACPFYRQHPEWRQVSKNGRSSGLSFYYPQVRQERVDILVEVAQRGANGLLIGCDRQVPMLQYEPAMVEEFRAQTGIDARKIDESDRSDFERWIRFRAGFFTETLRELRRRLEPLQALRGARIPVGIRIPSGGLLINLAQGLDVETWCRESLVQLIDLDPLEEYTGEGSHDVQPYLALGRKHGVRVYGGVGSTAFRDLRVFAVHEWDRAVITVGLKRARGLHRAGVDGIDTFETEVLAWTDPVRFAVALYGHPEELQRYLEESNIEAVYPVDAGNAAAGHDNHSVWRAGATWSLSGFGDRSW